jgi:hypothetical protein
VFSPDAREREATRIFRPDLDEEQKQPAVPVRLDGGLLLKQADAGEPIPDMGGAGFEIASSPEFGCEWCNGIKEHAANCPKLRHATSAMEDATQPEKLQAAFMQHSGPKCALCPFEVAYDPDWGKMSAQILAHGEREHSLTKAADAAHTTGGEQPVTSPGCIARGHVWNNYNPEWQMRCITCGATPSAASQDGLEIDEQPEDEAKGRETMLLHKKEWDNLPERAKELCLKNDDYWYTKLQNCFAFTAMRERQLIATRAELADRNNHITLAYSALGETNRSVYLFDHIYKLRDELAAAQTQIANLNSLVDRIALIAPACQDEGGRRIRAILKDRQSKTKEA